MKSGNLDFLEPSGPLQACDGAALPFTLHIGGRSYIRNLRARHAVVTGTHLPRYGIHTPLVSRRINHKAKTHFVQMKVTLWRAESCLFTVSFFSFNS